MQEILYDLKPTTQQESHDCAQANLSLLLSYYGITKSVSEIKAAVPVYVNKEGTELGSSVGHIASYALDLGLKATLHVSDVQLFDQSWDTKNTETLKSDLMARAEYIHHGVYDTETLKMVADGLCQFVDKGGTIATPVVDERYIYEQLQHGPLFFVVNYQYLFQRPRFLFTKNGKETDTIKGGLTTHVLTVCGYKNGQFCVINTVRPPEEAIVWVPANRLVAAYYLADIDLDSMFLTISK